MRTAFSSIGSSVVNLVLSTLTGNWKPHIGYWPVNWQFGMLCQLISSKLVCTALQPCTDCTELQKCM